MIPLVQWLVVKAEEDNPIKSPLPDSREASPKVIAEEKNHAEQMSAAALDVLRLEEALRDADQRFAKVVQEHERKELEFRDLLGRTLSDQIATEIKNAFAALAHQIEEAAAEALEPFLEGEVRKCGIKRLIELIREQLSSPEMAVLEIRAPARLHPQLSEALGGVEVSIAISEGEFVELVFTAGRVRFQDLASTWVAALAGDCT